MEHTSLGNTTYSRSKTLYQLINSGNISIAANRKLKIFGRLDCKRGKRMKITNRVFFTSVEAAILAGYRPCGHCMSSAYLDWKNNIG